MESLISTFDSESPVPSSPLSPLSPLSLHQKVQTHTPSLPNSSTTSLHPHPDASFPSSKPPSDKLVQIHPRKRVLLDFRMVVDFRPGVVELLPSLNEIDELIPLFVSSLLKILIYPMGAEHNGSWIGLYLKVHQSNHPRTALTIVSVAGIAQFVVVAVAVAVE
ncbi:MAG: hypothetical protein NXY57DRAFT_970328 [Lentinula lateritia]|nr:MAG: hypothetical protein NXY57DRAFT_970328 [Lentinula lateritia]